MGDIAYNGMLQTYSNYAGNVAMIGGQWDSTLQTWGVSVHRYNSGSDIWAQDTPNIIVPPSSGPSGYTGDAMSLTGIGCGGSVSEDGTRIAFGAPYTGIGGGATGSVWIYDYTTSWESPYLISDYDIPYLGGAVYFGTGNTGTFTRSILVSNFSLFWLTFRTYSTDFITNSFQLNAALYQNREGVTGAWEKTRQFNFPNLSGLPVSSITPGYSNLNSLIYYHPTSSDIYVAFAGYDTSESPFFVYKLYYMKYPTYDLTFIYTARSTGDAIIVPGSNDEAIYGNLMVSRDQQYLLFRYNQGGSNGFRVLYFYRPNSSSSYSLIYTKNELGLSDNFYLKQFGMIENTNMISNTVILPLQPVSEAIRTFKTKMKIYNFPPTGFGGLPQTLDVMKGSTGTKTEGGFGVLNGNTKSNVQYASGGGFNGASSISSATNAGGGSGQVNTGGSSGGDGYIIIRRFNSGL